MVGLLWRSSHKENPRLKSLKFFKNNVPDGGDLPVVAMIYSRTLHADHFGGARAIKEAYPDVKVYGSKIYH